MDGPNYEPQTIADDRVPDAWDFAQTPDAAGPVVLVVDDDTAVASATAMLLETAGFVAVVASDASQAFDHARRQTIDLLICDYRLGPGETGDEVIRGVRETLHADVPAILVSGDASRDIRATVRDFAACRVLNKPVDPDELLDIAARLAGAAADPAALTDSLTD